MQETLRLDIDPSCGQGWEKGTQRFFRKRCWGAESWVCCQSRRLKSQGRGFPNPSRRFGHVLGSKLVQPLEQLILQLQILHDSLHHQVCAVHDGGGVGAGGEAAQGLRYELVTSLGRPEGEERIHWALPAMILGDPCKWVL